MDLSQVKKFDDNSLFRFLSKSYSRHKSKEHLNSSTITQNLSSQHIKTRYNQKIRSQSSSFCNTFSRSLTICQNNSLPRPGFLKYRKFSKNQSVPLNSSLQTPKKQIQKLNITIHTTNEKNFANQKNFKDLRKTISQFESTPNVLQEFGLRNLVKRVKHDFVFSQEKVQKNQGNTSESAEYDMLCAKSKKMFSGHRSYNLNSFVITENSSGLLKRDGKNGIKTSIMKRRLKRDFERKNNQTLG